MKELQLIRHGKSSWKEGLPDHSRPLAPRGERAAPEMGRRLQAAGAVPDCLLSSDAVRARATAHAIAEAAGLGADTVALDASLYEADASDLLACARGLDDAYTRVALVGHNPTIAAAAEWLCGLQAHKVPTAAVIRIRFPVARWAELAPGAGELIDFDYPKRSSA